MTLRRNELDELLINAASGSPVSITTLTNHVGKHKLVDVSVVDFTINALRLHHPPFRVSRSSPLALTRLFLSHNNVATAVATLQLLAVYLGIAHKSDADHKGSIIDRLQSGWKVVSRWIVNLAIFESHEDLCAAVITSVLYFSPLGRVLVGKSALSIQSIFMLWTTPFQLDSVDYNGGRSAAWDIIFDILEVEEAVHAFNKILRNKETAIQFASALTNRLQAFREDLDKDPEQSKLVLGHLISFGLRLSHFQRNRHLWAALKRADSLPVMISLLRFMGAECDSHLDENDWRLLSSVGFVLLNQCYLLPMGFKPIGHAASILGAGFVPLILTTLSRLKDRPTDLGFFHDFLRNLQGFIFFPQIAQSLRSTFQHCTPDWYECVRGLSECPAPSVPAAFWSNVSGYLSDVTEYMQSPEADTKSYVCDNRKHVGNFPPTGHRACACQLAAYCSVDCQRQDWKASHRLECRFSRVTPTRDDLPSGRVKRHLTGYLVYLYKRTRFTQTSPCQIILIHPEHGPYFRTVPVTAYVAELSRHRVPVFSRPLIKQFAESVSVPDVLIEGVFRWGLNAAVRILVLLRVVENRIPFDTDESHLPWVVSSMAYITYATD